MQEPPKHLFLGINKEQPPFAHTLTSILQYKKHTDDQNQNIVQKILLKSMPVNRSEPQSDECNSLSLKLSTLFSTLINSIVPSTNQVLPLLEHLMQRTRDRVKLLQSPYLFHPFAPTLLTPLPLPMGILYSPQFRSHRETKMTARWTQQSTSMISRKIGDCEQSIVNVIIIILCCFNCVPNNW